MRTIKFRGKRVDNEEWMYGDLLHDRGLGGDVISGVVWIRTSNGRSYLALPKSVGQWTGMVDKNGKEIFEGDIAKEDDSNWGYGGEYDTTHDGYLYNPVEFRNGAFYIGDNLLGEWSGFEIVGNIHDKICTYNDSGCGSCDVPSESRTCNPELMEVE